MNETVKKTVTAAKILGLFSLLGLGLVALTFNQTKEKISQNERDALLKSLRAVVSSSLYNNDIANDKIQVTGLNPGAARETTIYRARDNGEPVAAVITALAPDGYNGNISLLVGILADGTLSGVRVVSHKETPGLGDSIETDRSNWILSFDGKSLAGLTDKQWAVKRDGGVFDQFTGATITPRAVVKSVKNALLYFQQHKVEIFSNTEPAEE
ncbi:MAG: electron transport complex subunit RsxG [Gammaproteobacteria bacterium HGW-Gammaproteobacteria-3]|nr:MAG: electron transport complex subunit RsxG [Gammaproteobacteria bacterium HGW-Gammaproteobacteria-3]